MIKAVYLPDGDGRVLPEPAFRFQKSLAKVSMARISYKIVGGYNVYSFYPVCNRCYVETERWVQQDFHLPDRDGSVQGDVDAGGTPHLIQSSGLRVEGRGLRVEG